MVGALQSSEQLDVVGVLLTAHVETRHALSLAESIATKSPDASTAEAARRVCEYVDGALALHTTDEEESLAPALACHHPVVDDAIETMKREHFKVGALLARVRMLCAFISRDVSRLQLHRFELASAVRDLRRELDAHHALEESILFPAVRRLLSWDRQCQLRDEMFARRVLS